MVWVTFRRKILMAIMPLIYWIVPAKMAQPVPQVQPVLTAPQVQRVLPVLTALTARQAQRALTVPQVQPVLTARQALKVSRPAGCPRSDGYSGF